MLAGTSGQQSTVIIAAQQQPGEHSHQQQVYSDNSAEPQQLGQDSQSQQHQQQVYSDNSRTAASWQRLTVTAASATVVASNLQASSIRVSNFTRHQMLHIKCYYNITIGTSNCVPSDFVCTTLKLSLNNYGETFLKVNILTHHQGFPQKNEKASW